MVKAAGSPTHKVAPTSGTLKTPGTARGLAITPHGAAGSLRPTFALAGKNKGGIRVKSFPVPVMRPARQRRSLLLLCMLALGLFSGCTTTSVLLSAAGVATDSSVPWAIVKHVHGKLTEGDPTPCVLLNSVQRALNERCGEFVPGSLKAEDIQRPGMATCPLTVAARDPQFWPVLPELLAKGAQPERCTRSPLVALAQNAPCPAFDSASPAALRSLAWLAEADARAIDHDVVRLFSCPSARLAGLDQVLDKWQAQGDLPTGTLAFSPLGALHPVHLDSPLARALEAQGHTAQAALGAYAGALPSGFELALRGSHWRALDWWLARAPQLANRVPPAQGNQLPWLPLARVLAPNFLERPDTQAELVEYLMARGASPWHKLPADPGRSVVQLAVDLRSPMLPLLDPPPPPRTTVVAESADPAAFAR